MFRVLVAAALCICSPLTASAASLVELTPFLSGQYFTWEEYDGGRRLLKESGPLVSGGLVVRAEPPSNLSLQGKLEVFGGEVGYNGETMPPNPVPLRTSVSYLGTREELDLGYRLTFDRLRLIPFAGTGYRWWMRDLHDATDASGRPTTGYTEWWRTWYSRLGGRVGCDLPSEVTLSAEGGAKYPFYVSNSTDFAGLGTFRPGARWSAFAEAGIGYRQLRVNLSYEGFRFGASPLKQSGGIYYLQPASSSDIFGLSLGWSFR